MAKEFRTHARTRRDDRKRDLFSRADSEQTLFDGRVVSRFGSQADIRDDKGEIWRAHLRQHLKSLAVGDEVEWHPSDGHTAVVVNLKPRRSVLERPNPYEGLKVIAANLDHLLIVIAPLPAFSELLLDRYLVASEATNIAVTIVVNKADLLSADARAELESRLQGYVTLGYDLCFVSARSEQGLAPLKNLLKSGLSVLVGQSGVGKSSLLNALHPVAAASVGAVSDNSDLGQHTTSASRLFDLPDGGALIDSPGVREFGLWHMSREQITRGFRDIQALSGHCKFRNCLHEHEPGCAVKHAVETGDLSPLRWQSYRAILEANASQV